FIKGAMIRVLYAAALFTSAMLLFLIQPMIAKMILPLLGGTPAVWNTCLVFFQTTLLAGDLYAHGSARFFAPRRQSGWHMVFLLVPFLALPLLLLPRQLQQGAALSSSVSTTPAWAVLDRLGIYPNLLEMPDHAWPTAWLLLLLVVCVGLPFFVVSATAPLLQHWFAGIGLPDSNDPYFLYAASNSGSFLALLSYPVIVEPYLTLQNQVRVWEIGYGLLVVIIASCAFVLWKHRSEIGEQRTVVPDSLLITHHSSLILGRRLSWLMLTAIPSSL